MDNFFYLHFQVQNEASRGHDERAQERRQLTIENLSDARMLEITRFNKAQFIEIMQFLLFPETVLLSNRSRFSGQDALLALLMRLSWPRRLKDIAKDFFCSEAAISLLFNWALEHVCQVVDDLGLLQLRALEAGKVAQFTSAIAHKTDGTLESCIGFIDGTAREICRPQRDQQDFYSGHYRMHCVKYQAVTLPNGIIVDLCGPWMGSLHDATIYRLSDIEARMRSISLSNERILQLCGDKAYPRSEIMITPRRTHTERINTPENREFNTKLSRGRIAAEWAFQKVLSLWQALLLDEAYKKDLMPINKYYRCAVLLTNIHTIYNGSQVSTSFEVAPPTLNEYFTN